MSSAVHRGSLFVSLVSSVTDEGTFQARKGERFDWTKVVLPLIRECLTDLPHHIA